MYQCGQYIFSYTLRMQLGYVRTSLRDMCCTAVFLFYLSRVSYPGCQWGLISPHPFQSSQGSQVQMQWEPPLVSKAL
ncbi:unnamed protein product [Prorocentrum cordatum]|uniref:Uncharacterized protein n=1 Tax=Prorocentrum cordatum TaxID=2364126 RepID=A0ABN9R3U0_9DINO|nr:unnamed protein product [Polarella glacialis]